METKYSTLKRPKRKLCYITTKESSSKQWEGKLTPQDIDKIFDDLDSDSDGDDLLPTSPLLKTLGNTEKKEREASVPQCYPTEKHPECQMGSKGELLHPTMRSASPELDTDVDGPFKEHGPLKTSSPIEGNVDLEETAVSPILFECEDDGKAEQESAPDPVQKPQGNGHSTEISEGFDLESPPSKFAFITTKIPSHRKVDSSCKDSQPVTEKTPKNSQPPALDFKRKTATQGNSVSVSVRQKPEHTFPEKKSESVRGQPVLETCSRVDVNMTAFLQKLRDAGQPKPACSRKTQPAAKVATPPPQPEDDFVILEDDAPVWFSIPSKTATNKRQNKIYSVDKESSSDKQMDESQPKIAQKLQETDQTNNKPGCQKTAHQESKQNRGKDSVADVPATSRAQMESKRMKAEGLGNYKDGHLLFSQEDFPEGDMIKPDKANEQNQRLKLMPSKDRQSVDQRKDSSSSSSRESDKEKKSQKTSEDKRLKSAKDRIANIKTNRAKSLKGRTERINDALKETLKQQSQEQSSEECGGAEDPYSPQQQAEQDFHSAKEIAKLQRKVMSKDLTNGKDEQDKVSTAAEDTEDVLRKRKRRQPGQWWLSCPTTEETKVTDNQPILKKSKQNQKKPRTVATSPVKAKNDRVLKKNLKRSTPSPSQTAKHKAKEKKKQTKKATDNVSNEIVEEQIQDQEEEQDQDLNPRQLEIFDEYLESGHCSPLEFPHRDHSLDSHTKHQVFLRVYSHVSNDKISSALPIPHRGTPQQLKTPEPEKRRRRCPGNWWEVNKASEHVEIVSSQIQQLKTKKPKGRSTCCKQSRSPALGAPKNGNMAVPKTVKCSLATFKDLFTSAAESPFISSSRDAYENSRCNVAGFPGEGAVQVSAIDYKLAKTDRDVFSMDAVESCDVRRDGKRFSDSTSKCLQSGPASMIELEQYEENEDFNLPSSKVSQSVLSVSELCAPPLKPLVLEERDKANLTEWLKRVWSTTVGSESEITPEQFDWFFYQGRAIGFQVDLQCSSFCNGKILLGSYMKKPLWVDHTATTAFNVLTSSVSVTIDGSESRFRPGQSFMVVCGRAYSIQNLSAQPAVLYFNRMLAGNLD
ncbi:hypothetical protein LDENG_00203230 [Lucifuga dentata]|nr:hypothetical protein LDENG_00203230 [Lucifuga dentata]